MGQDQLAIRTAITLEPLEEPPIANCFCGKAGRVKAIANTDKPLIGTDFINAVGNRLANCVLRPVMHQHRFGYFAPSSPCVFEVPN